MCRDVDGTMDKDTIVGLRARVKELEESGTYYRKQIDNFIKLFELDGERFKLVEERLDALERKRDELCSDYLALR